MDDESRLTTSTASCRYSRHRRELPLSATLETLVVSAPPTVSTASPADSTDQLSNPNQPPAGVSTTESNNGNSLQSPFQHSVSAIELHAAGNFTSTSESWFQDDLSRQVHAPDEPLESMEISGSFGAGRLSESDLRLSAAAPDAFVSFALIPISKSLPVRLTWVHPDVIIPFKFTWPDWVETSWFAVLDVTDTISAMDAAQEQFTYQLTALIPNVLDKSDGAEGCENVEEAIKRELESVRVEIERFSSASGETQREVALPNDVLKCVLTYCAEPDVFNWRLVNRQWNFACSAWLRSVKISKVFIMGDEQVESFLETIPFPNITLFNAFALEEVYLCLENSVAFKFLMRFGAQMESLELHHVIFPNVDTLLQVLSRLTYLKSLALDISSFKSVRLEGSAGLDAALLEKLETVNMYVASGGSMQPFENFLKDFFTFVAPKALVLKMEPPEGAMKISTESYETFVRCALACKTVEQLCFPLCLSEKVMKTMTSARLPLSDMDLIVKEDLVRSSVLYNMLKALSGTLKFLKLTFRLNNMKVRNASFELPPFAALKGLTLNNFFGGPEALGFLQKCQTLLSLDLLGVPHYEHMLPPRMKALERMQQLRILPCAYPSSIAFQRIMALFPNLTSLYIDDVQDYALRGIFMELPKLEALTLKGHFTDEGISGIPTEKSNEIASFELTEEIDPEYLRVAPFIGDLKKLRQLYIASDKITDLSVTLALVTCRRLKRLTIVSPQVTQAAIATLVTDLAQLKHLDVSGCPKLTRSNHEMLQTTSKMANDVSIVFSNVSKVSTTVIHGVLIKRVRFNEAQCL